MKRLIAMMLLMPTMALAQSLGEFYSSYVPGGVWLEERVRQPFVGMDASADPTGYFTQGETFPTCYGRVDLLSRASRAYAIKCEVDSGFGVYAAQINQTLAGDELYFTLSGLAVEGFPVLDGLLYYTMKATVSSAGCTPISKSVRFQVSSPSVSLPEALDCTSARNEGLVSITSPSGKTGSSWFGTKGIIRDCVGGSCAQSGLCTKGGTSTLEAVFEMPMLLDFDSYSTGGTLTMVKNVGTKASSSTVLATGERHSALVATGGTERVQWTFRRDNSNYDLMNLCAGFLDDFQLRPLCRVSFDSNGGMSVCKPIWTVQGMAYNTLEPFPEEGPRPPDPEKTAYGKIIKVHTFDGWYRGSERVTGSSIAPQAASVTLVAHWKDEDPRPEDVAGEQPDLIPTLTVDPISGTEDDRFDFKLTLSNVGAGDAGPFVVRLFCDGEKMGADMYESGLLSGASKVRHRHRFGSNIGSGAGLHLITVVVDYQNAVAESNEKNNSDVRTVVVTRPVAGRVRPKANWTFAVPDGAPDALSLSKSPSGGPASAFSQGSPIYVTMGCRNATGAAVDTPVSALFTLYREDAEIGDMEVVWEGVKAGTTATLSEEERQMAMLQGLSYGNYVLRCQLDPEDEYDESNERDNERRVAFTVSSTGTGGGQSDGHVTVRFFSDALAGTPSSTLRYVRGERYGWLPIPVRDDAVFLGWFTLPEGGERVDESWIAETSVDCYAHWRTGSAGEEAACHLVTFRANGGKYDRMESRPDGAVIGAFPEVSRSGYELVGWFSAAVGGKPVMASTPVFADMTCYAQWVKVVSDCHVTFDGNGGSPVGQGRTLAKGTVLGALPDVTRSGWNFLGWYTTPRGGTKVTSATKVSSDLTIYAHWRARSVSAPNLKVESLIVSDSQPFRSETVVLRWRVLNDGEAASGASTCRVSVGGTVVNVTVPALAAGASVYKTASLSMQKLGLGGHDICVSADSADVVDEISESDNENWISVDVRADNAKVSSRVDWTFSAKSGEPASVYLSTSLKSRKSVKTFKQGAPIYVQINFKNAKRVRTIGMIYVRAEVAGCGSETWYWNNGLGATTIGYLTNSTRAPAMLQNLPPGVYTIKVILDPYNNWWETNEKNNVKTLTFSVVGKPQIVCESSYEGVAGVSAYWPVTGDGTVTMQGLPSGLSFKKGVISGKPKKPGVYPVVVKAKNVAGTAKRTITIRVNNPGFDVSVRPKSNTAGVFGTLTAADTVRMYVGVAQSMSVGAEVGLAGVSGSAATISVKGLPKGLSYSKGKITGVPSNAGSGTVTVTCTNKWKWKTTFKFKYVVSSRPVWAAGTFNGECAVGTSGGTVSMTVSSGGKLSGKLVVNGKSYPFSAKSLSSYRESGVDAGSFGVSAKVKVGSKSYALTFELRPVSYDVSGTKRGLLEAEDPTGNVMLSADQNVWARKDIVLPVYAANQIIRLTSEQLQGLGLAPSKSDKLSLTVGKKGVIKVAGKFGGKSVSCSVPARLLWHEGGEPSEWIAELTIPVGKQAVSLPLLFAPLPFMPIATMMMTP